MQLQLGDRSHDVTSRALIMGILRHPSDPSSGHGEVRSLDHLHRQAEQLVAEGADVLDVGGPSPGAGAGVSEQEELDCVVPAVEALHQRFEVPLSCDTSRASVARAAYGAGAVVANDRSGFADPDYLAVAAAAGATVITTHVGVATVAEVAASLAKRGRSAEAAGLPPTRIVIDAGLDLGKTWRQSIALLRGSSVLAGLGYPLCLSASNATFLGTLLDLGTEERREASHAAHAIGVIGGCRILRAHDVRGARRVADVVAALVGDEVSRG
ncbi:MAG TPA: dihydropteroate synthase [Acidimicrobiales bacterium]|nr:dihydropteroate synthase [Acidimicrobiales bacterium]